MTKKKDSFQFVGCIVAFACLLSNQGLAQVQSMISKSSESLRKIEASSTLDFSQIFYPIGKKDGQTVFLYRNRKARKRTLFSLIEGTKTSLKELEGFDNSMASFTANQHIRDSLMVYTKYYLDAPDEYGYSKLMITIGNEDIMLDSIYNADKKIHSSFSSDGNYLLINTLNTLSDFYNPEQDDRIALYDLKTISGAKVQKKYIQCVHCSDSYLVGNTFFFTKGRKDGYDGFTNKDIYSAPWGNLGDSVKIASNTDLLAISLDGKYILGSRFFDTQSNTNVIIDVESKTYQLLLGRDYHNYRGFYSNTENKFGFSIDGYVVYVDFPTRFPFSALKWKNEGIPDWTEKQFWNQFQHQPLK